MYNLEQFLGSGLEALQLYINLELGPRLVKDHPVETGSYAL